MRRLLSLTIGGFAALLTVGLIMGAQTSGVAQRLPYAIVVFGAQMLYVFATTMAMRPPGVKVVVAVGLLSALAADYRWPTAPTRRRSGRSAWSPRAVWCSACSARSCCARAGSGSPSRSAPPR